MRRTIEIILLWALAAATLTAAAPQSNLYMFLRTQLSFTPLEFAELEKGHTVVKLPPTMEPREVAAFAITRLNVSSEFYVNRFRDIARFKQSENVLQIGKFGNPPRLEDLANLSLDPAEIEALRLCQLNKCTLKMPAQFIERFRTGMDWAAPNYRERANGLMREMLIEYVRQYLHGGNAELADYRDKPYRVRLGDEVRSLLQPAPYMYGYAREFQTYLETFPQSRPPDSEDFIYWSKEKFGLKPVISITHVTIYKGMGADGRDTWIASKGIYASHYFDASLGLTALVHDGSSDPSRLYLLYLNRTRADALRGVLSGMKRSLISSSLREGAQKNMDIVRKRLESEYRN